MTYDADVAVIGLGSSGSMAAWRLTERGARVHGYEQFGIGHDRGAAGGESRMFRSTSLRDPRFIPLARDAVAFWRRLESVAGRQLMNLCGELVIGGPSTPTMHHLHKLLDEHALPHEVIDRDEMLHRYPEHRLAEDEYAVRDFTAGFVRPELAVLAAVERARSRGAEIYPNTTVEALTPDTAGVDVTVAGRSRRYRKVVLTAGPWAGALLPEYTAKIQVRRVLAAWFAPRDPREFGADRFPVFLRFMDGTDDAFYGFPRVDGSTVKLGLPTTNKPIDDAGEFARLASIAEIDEYSRVVARYLPGLHPQPIRTAAFVEGYTSDGHGLVGPLPSAESVVALFGLSGHGFKYVPLLGDIAADYVLDGGTGHDVDFLLPHRPLDDWTTGVLAPMKRAHVGRT
jgi:sarcosine oxidase